MGMEINSEPSLIAGRYQIMHLLGAGERKRVYLAVDPQLDAEVAIALIPSSDPAEVEVNAWEAKVTAKLRAHPHILTVYDTGHEDHWSYIVSQYMAGGDLRTLLHDMKQTGSELSLDRCLRVGRQVCDALVHTHEQRIVHRDIQPANVWFDRPNGDAYLGDFDLAVALDDAEPIPSELVTTRAYMPPEQVLGKDVTELGDLYSFGATLYHAVAGQPPFEGNDQEILEQHVSAEPAPPSTLRSEVPLALDILVGGLLSKDPADRPAGATEVLEALNAMPASTAPDEFELERTIDGQESTHVELKASFRQWSDPNKPVPPDELELMVAKTIAAFMNTEGGTLLIGIEDNGAVLGVEHDYPTLGKKGNLDGWELTFRTKMRNMLSRDAASAISLFFVPYKGKTVAVVQCRPRSSETWTRTKLGETFFVREGNGTQPLSPREAANAIRKRWPA